MAGIGASARMLLTLTVLVLAPAGLAQGKTAAPVRALVSTAPVRGGLALVSGGSAIPILVAPGETPAAARAAHDLASDIEAVTGKRPELRTAAGPGTSNAIIVGTLGQSAFIDAMTKTNRLSTVAIGGKWESFLIATVEHPIPGVARALVIAGSDRRGTAFGIYELSRAIGVNPWSWWADLAPRHRDSLFVAGGLRHFGPPSVRYRGIFVNDEDWGLFPWASQTFDPDRKDIGPKSYAKIFELMLRLKANTLWPAMHATTAAFNSDPANAKLADEYGIVMGSSHAEAMLRNNVGEWKAPVSTYDYAANPEGVRAYWEERVKLNADFENVWTIGMRGLHDTGMVGTRTVEERVRLLGKIISDQRAMLDNHVAGGSDKAAQIFVPYKEVLDIYRAGLKVPDNATIVWPDDNFGYIRQFPSKSEAARSGGTGVYYHLSYLGYPLSYLWLSTTPPALVREEMVRAYDQGSRTFWMVNVGDIKPAEIGMTHFLDLAWDTDRFRAMSQQTYLRSWLEEAFGSTEAGTKASEMLDEYFHLNFERRPEHLEWPAQSEGRHLSSYSPAEVNYRLNRWRRLSAEAMAVGKTVPADRRDAWFELVEFPIRGAAAANIRFFAAERFDELIEIDPARARSAGGAIAWAEAEIASITDRYNNRIANGKWRYLMPAEPADSQWRIYRPRPIVTPPVPLRTNPDAFFAEVDRSTAAPATGVVEAEDRIAAGWRLVEGLGRGRGVLVADRKGAPWTGAITLAPGQDGVALALLPLFPDGDDRELGLEVTIDGGPPHVIKVSREVGSAAWVQGVLDNMLRVPLGSGLAPGQHMISIAARTGGVALDRLMPVAAASASTGH